MKPLTYDDWQAAGYQVRRGEKAKARDAKGRPAFTRDQVEPARGDFMRLNLTDDERESMGLPPRRDR